MSDDSLTPQALITAFLLAAIAEQPVSRRIDLYRALAVTAQDKALRDECTARADEYESVARREAQMLLAFRARNA